MRYLQTLDPRNDHQEIHRVFSTDEFPWDYGRGLEIAIWRSCCIASISSLLHATGEFSSSAIKRYDDTRILLGELVTHGYTSERGKQALRRINLTHRRYDIDNSDMLYVLSTFVFEPIRWIDRWGWRRVTQTEKLGSFLFFKEVGRRMNISSIPDDFAAFEIFNREYERANFRRTDASAHVGTDILRLYASLYPRPLRPMATTVLRCRIDRAARQALDIGRPPAWAYVLQEIVLRGHGTFELLAPELAARLFRRPVARTYPGYPHGYELSQIGPFPATEEDLDAADLSGSAVGETSVHRSVRAAAPPRPGPGSDLKWIGGDSKWRQLGLSRWRTLLRVPSTSSRSTRRRWNGRPSILRWRLAP